MSLSKRFQQDLGYYMLGVIVPATINACTIPLLKKFLGAAGFGVYGIRYNFFLLMVAFSVGWLCQSVIRFKFSVVGEERSFYSRVFKLGGSILCAIAVISFCVGFLYLDIGFLFSLLFATSFIFCGFQNILIAISQSNFLSRFTMYSEAVRTGLFFISAILLLQVDFLSSINALFLALNISYFVSSAMLFFKNKLLQQLAQNHLDNKVPSFNTNELFKYGLPIAAWYLFSYLIMFMDKPLLAGQYGYEVQGNYQALYEIISKGAVVLLIPVHYALFPLLSKAFESNDEKTGLLLLKKIILIEAALLVAVLIGYWLVGFDILKFILTVPDQAQYKWCGFIMLASTIIWQIGMLSHKPFELRKRTLVLLWIVLGSSVVFFALLFLVARSSMAIYKYSLPFLGAGISYVLICFFMLGYHKKMRRQVSGLPRLFKEKFSD